MTTFPGIKDTDASTPDRVRIFRSDGGIAIQAMDGLYRTSTTAFVHAPAARQIAAELNRLAAQIEPPHTA